MRAVKTHKMCGTRQGGDGDVPGVGGINVTGAVFGGEAAANSARVQSLRMPRNLRDIRSSTGICALSLGASAVQHSVHSGDNLAWHLASAPVLSNVNHSNPVRHNEVASF